MRVGRSCTFGRAAVASGGGQCGGPMKRRSAGILLLALAFSAGVVASVAFGAKASVESTYEFRQIDGQGLLDKYVYTHRCSTDRIKQGEPLVLYRLLAHTHKIWCFSGDTYDIQQVGLNFRVAYTPRGRPHPVTGAPFRLEVPIRNRAWVDRANNPDCVQYGEITATIPGYETAPLAPGCYVLEENWEYGPSPPPTGTQQQESGSLPQFCVDAAGPPPPPPPPAPPPPAPPAPPPPPPGSQPTRTTLLAASFTTLPRNPQAGRIFTARLRVVTADGDTVSRGTVACSLGNARARSQMIARGFRRASAFCTWRIARKMRGLKLRGSLSVRSRGGIIVKSFTRRVT